MSELARAVFEVDHRPLDKLRRIGGLARTAGRVVSVSSTWRANSLVPPSRGRLRSAGRDDLVWEGVVPYLTATEVNAAVAQVAKLSAPESHLVVTF
jgi:O-methyltransferase involved in polyketide biosynthesis